MPLDMTGDARHNPGVHYRRYLDRDNKVAVICVQDFDYIDYDASRFLDFLAFDDETDAEYTPLRAADAFDTARTSGSQAVAVQAAVLLDAIEAHNKAARPSSQMGRLLMDDDFDC